MRNRTILLLSTLALFTMQAGAGRVIENWNFDWLFHRGPVDVENLNTEGLGGAANQKLSFLCGGRGPHCGY